MQFPQYTTFRATPWTDPVVDLVGFDATSAYVELCWLPTLGPSATWMLRRLAAGFKVNPDGYQVDLVQLASDPQGQT